MNKELEEAYAKATARGIKKIVGLSLEITSKLSCVAVILFVMDI